MEVMGVPIDWFFHMAGAVIIVLVGSRFWPPKNVLILTIGLLVAKEIFDVFAKTRVEYIRAPGLDLAFDMAAGLAGAGIGWLLARRFPALRGRHDDGEIRQ